MPEIPRDSDPPAARKATPTKKSSRRALGLSLAAALMVFVPCARPVATAVIGWRAARRIHDTVKPGTRVAALLSMACDPEAAYRSFDARGEAANGTLAGFMMLRRQGGYLVFVDGRSMEPSSRREQPRTVELAGQVACEAFFHEHAAEIGAFSFFRFMWQGFVFEKPGFSIGARDGTVTAVDELQDWDRPPPGRS
jgi:hypothetical protein